jgi:predicted extracellular nuclease
MKTLRILLSLGLVAAFLASLAGMPAPAEASVSSPTGVVIAEVYGGGGNSGAYWKNDFIMLFNAGTAAVDISTWSVQYASSTGTSWQRTNLTGSIEPGQFYLVQEAAGANTAATPLPTPDAQGNIAMSATTGKVALVRNQTTLLADFLSLPYGDIEDFVGFGAASIYEGAGPAPVLSNTTADLRLYYGCQDSNDNAADFYLLAMPLPFNSASPKVLCGALPAVSTTTPANLSVGFPEDANLVITFNELVTLTDTAVSLECPAGTPVSFTGLPVTTPAGSVTLDPVAYLPPLTTCTVTVDAAGVTDVDITPDNLDGDQDGTPGDDYVFTFTSGGAPYVASTLPADNATAVKLDANISLTFSKPVTVSGEWFDIECSLSGEHEATVTDADPTFTLDPATDFLPGEVCTVTVLASLVTDDDLSDPPDNMEADYIFDFSTTACGAAGDTPISAIQDVDNTVVAGVYTVEAVVVGDYQPSSGFSGFYIQEEDADSDGNPLSSEGIFVYHPTAPDVQVGDLLRLSGTASDYSGLSQLASITSLEVCATGAPLPTASTVDLPVGNVNDLERYEGMRVTFVDELTVIESYQLGQYGQVVLSEGGRIATYTHLNPPNVNGYNAFTSETAKRKIILDDGLSISNPDSIIYPSPELTALNTLRMGDTIPALTGILDYRYSAYRVQPVGTVDFVHNNLRTAAPAPTGGTLIAASANVLNYFNTFTQCTNGIGGIPSDDQCRGADNAEEFARQRAKIIAQLVAMDADVVGLMEIENDGYGADSALQDLVNGLNDALGAGTYAFIDPDLANGVNALGSDYIRVALIYKPATLIPVGDPAVLNVGVFIQVDDISTTGNEVRNRVPLAQSFIEEASGEIFTVVVNHLKSKGSSCADPTTYLPLGDPDLQDGQGNCSQTRKMAAEEEAAWLDADPTGIQDEDILILGDLNSYAYEQPISALKAAGYTDLLLDRVGASAYGYVYSALYGYLDHALASPSLSTQVTGITEWHNNADEPTALDYDMTYKPSRLDTLLYAPDAYRASDHDPVLIGLDLSSQVMVYLPLALK